MRRSDICLYLGPADRTDLEALIINRNTPRKLVWRAEIVLATADGHGTFEIMRRARTSKPTVWRWQQRYLEEGVVGLKREMLDIWVLVVGLASAMLLCVGQEFLILLAGQDKAESAPVFVAIAIAMVWNSLFTIAQYGLLLQRRPLRVLVITVAATVLNLTLNVPLILTWGVTGAVTATLLSYAFLVLIQLWQCPTELRYLPPLGRMAGAALFAPVMLALLLQVDYFGAASTLSRLLVGAVTVMLPALVLAAMDKRLRHGIRQILIARGKS